MELAAPTYYSRDRFFNSFYLITATLQKYFAQELFKGDGTRMIYASTEFAFRQRLNQLNQNTQPDFNFLQFPFGCIYRNGAWDIDPQRIKGTTMLHAPDRGSSASAMSDPIPGRFIHAIANFTATLFFSRDDEAQQAYETLMWIKHPTPKLIAVEGFLYKGMKLTLPMTVQVDDITYAEGYKEKEWLQESRLVPISFTVRVASNILDQYAQGAVSSLFDTYIDDELGEIKLTETVILDFLAYHGEPYVDTNDLLLEVQSTLTPDPELGGSLTFSPPIDSGTGLPTYQDTAVTLTWDYNDGDSEGEPDVTGYYESNVKLTCSNGTSATAPMTDKTYTFTDLSPNSSYEFAIFFIANNGSVTKYSTTGSTSQEIAAPNLKGMIGLTW